MNPNELLWRLPAEKPVQNSWVIVHFLTGEFVEEYISEDEVFDQWNEAVIRWSYSPKWINHDIIKNVKEDENNETSDDFMPEPIIDDPNHKYCMGHWFSRVSNSDGDDRWQVDEFLEQAMAQRQSGMSESLGIQIKETSDGEDSSEPVTISDEQEYIAMRNQLYYMHAGSTGYDGTIYGRKEAVEDVINIIPYLERVAKKADPWFFVQD